MYKLLQGEVVPSPVTSKELVNIRQPIGVASMITPVSVMHVTGRSWILTYSMMNYVPSKQNYLEIICVGVSGVPGGRQGDDV